MNKCYFAGMNYQIRKGLESDLEGVLDLIKELALYEKAPHEVTVSKEQLRRDGFGERRLFEFIVAEFEGKVVGMAFYYYRYSTWKGKFLYLEDFVVSESFRGKGIGATLFDTVMQASLKEDCVGMSWQVLDWNEPALHFYKKYGAHLDGEWTNGRLLRSEIESLVNSKN